MRLINKSRQETVLANQINVASSFTSRLIGLLGRKSLPANECLWLRNCKSIHTFFMRFKIDVIFVDQTLTVQKVLFDVPKWRLIRPVKSANSVFEFSAGTINEKNVGEGDQLYVGT